MSEPSRGTDEIHKDDLIWGGTAAMDKVMDEITQ